MRNQASPRANDAKRRSWRMPGEGLLIPHGYLLPGKRTAKRFKSVCHRRVGGHVTDLKKYRCLSGVDEAKITKKHVI